MRRCSKQGGAPNSQVDFSLLSAPKEQNISSGVRFPITSHSDSNSPRRARAFEETGPPFEKTCFPSVLSPLSDLHGINDLRTCP